MQNFPRRGKFSVVFIQALEKEATRRAGVFSAKLPGVRSVGAECAPGREAV